MYMGSMVGYVISIPGRGEVDGAGTITGLALAEGDHPAVKLGHGRVVELRQITSVDSAADDQDDIAAWWWSCAEAWCIRHGGLGLKDRAACLVEMKRLRGAQGER